MKDITRFFIIVPTYSREMGYRNNVFGPYTTVDRARVVSDKVGPGEIVELPVRTLDEAIDLLSKEGYGA